MQGVGELIESSRTRTATPERRAVAARRVIEVARAAQLPWLLMLFPVGSLIAAGLLALLLSHFVPASPPPAPDDVPRVEHARHTTTAGDAAAGDWTGHFHPAYMR